jgi:transaldolase
MRLHHESDTLMVEDGGNCEEVLEQFVAAGIDIDALATELQDNGAKAFVKSWSELLGVLESKSTILSKA